MDEYIIQMIPQGLESPEVILDPEAGIRQGVILLAGKGVGPDLPQPEERPQRRVLGDIDVVIPYVPKVSYRQVNQERK